MTKKELKLRKKSKKSDDTKTSPMINVENKCEQMMIKKEEQTKK